MVCAAWQNVVDEGLQQLVVRSWPCPFSFPARFSQVRHLNVAQVKAVAPPGGVARARKKHRAHHATRAAAAARITAGAMEAGQQEERMALVGQPCPWEPAALAQELTCLPHLRALSISHDAPEGRSARVRSAARAFVVKFVGSLCTLPPLASITTLSLSGSTITSIPPSLFSALPSLVVIKLEGTRLITLPPASMGSLAHLEHISAGGNAQLARIPSSALTPLPALRTLDVSQCALSSLPPLGHLSALTSLQAAGNTLTALPQCIGDLRSLEHLDVSDNNIEALPASFSSLSLSTLKLGGNWQLGGALASLESFPDRMPNLRHLDVSGTGLQGLPRVFGLVCPGLKELYLSCNELSELPPTLCGMTSLRVLALDYNE